jgi:hypothetical protein
MTYFKFFQRSKNGKFRLWCFFSLHDLFENVKYLLTRLQDKARIFSQNDHVICYREQSSNDYFKKGIRIYIRIFLHKLAKIFNVLVKQRIAKCVHILKAIQFNR